MDPIIVRVKEIEKNNRVYCIKLEYKSKVVEFHYNAQACKEILGIHKLNQKILDNCIGKKIKYSSALPWNDRFNELASNPLIPIGLATEFFEKETRAAKTLVSKL